MPRIGPPLLYPQPEYDQGQMIAFVHNLEMRFRDLERAITDQVYTPSNVTITRSFDADSTSLSEVADVLGTLINDLQLKGWLPGETT